MATSANNNTTTPDTQDPLPSSRGNCARGQHPGVVRVCLRRGGWIEVELTRNSRRVADDGKPHTLHRGDSTDTRCGG
jgi:hypothetical protein